MKERILVVDDTKDMVSFLQRLINKEFGIDAIGLTRSSDVVKTVSSDGIDLVVTDVKMPEKDGITLLKELKEIDRDIIVIILTGYGSVDLAVEALKQGAYDFLTKPINNERLIHTLRRALDYRRVVKEKSLLEEKIRYSSLRRELIGESDVMKRLIGCIKTVAGTDETVLITGETGTGKELAARTIHRLSKRVEGPFIAVNCPAIPETIMESELFGYKKGAFTSAATDRKGLFEAATGGTIFLDEIGDIPLSIQTKLLRVLQEKEFKPLGDTGSVKVDVRVIASTNQNIEKKIERGMFREDLYYRLNVITIRMPSLKERTEDIPLLANHFLMEYSLEYGKDITGFSDEALHYLCSRNWRGNIRELQNVIKRAVIFSKGPTVEGSILEDFSLDPSPGSIGSDAVTECYRVARSRVLEQFTVNYLRHILQRTSGNVTYAARLAGIERQSLQHLLKKYKIEPREYRERENTRK